MNRCASLSLDVVGDDPKPPGWSAAEEEYSKNVRLETLAASIRRRLSDSEASLKDLTSRLSESRALLDSLSADHEEPGTTTTTTTAQSPAPDHSSVVVVAVPALVLDPPERIPARRRFSAVLYVDRAWREQAEVSERDVVRAAQGARCLNEESMAPAFSCETCGDGAPFCQVGASARRAVGPVLLQRAEGVVERYTFDSCTISCSDCVGHLGGRFVMFVSVREGLEPVMSAPFCTVESGPEAVASQVVEEPVLVVPRVALLGFSMRDDTARAAFKGMAESLKTTHLQGLPGFVDCQTETAGELGVLLVAFEADDQAIAASNLVAGYARNTVPNVWGYDVSALGLKLEYVVYSW